MPKKPKPPLSLTCFDRKQYSKQYYEQNKQKILQYQKEYYKSKRKPKPKSKFEIRYGKFVIFNEKW